MPTISSNAGSSSAFFNKLACTKRRVLKNEGSSSSLHCAFCCWGFSIIIFSDCKGKPRFLRLFGFSRLVPTFSNIFFKFELNSQKKMSRRMTGNLILEDRKAACTTHLRILIRKLLNSLSHSHCTTNIFFFSESVLFKISCYFLESK